MKIKINNLSKKFKNNFVLKNVNLTFESGNIYGLYGRNGSGKSVFMKLLCGFYLPSSGEILYNKINYNDMGQLPDNLGALIEKPSFFPDLTGYENLKLLSDIQKKIDLKDIDKTLKLVNLYSEKDKKYKEYSLGMKQKLGIAQAIMENQKIILLDEPFNGVDKKTVDKLINYFLTEKDNDKLIIISTHIKEDLERLTDKIYYFDGGTIIDNENK